MSPCRCYHISMHRTTPAAQILRTRQRDWSAVRPVTSTVSLYHGSKKLALSPCWLQEGASCEATPLHQFFNSTAVERKSELAGDEGVEHSFLFIICMCECVYCHWRRELQLWSSVRYRNTVLSYTVLFLAYRLSSVPVRTSREQIQGFYTVCSI